MEHELTSEKDWDNPNYDKLWLYNLHYFDDLTAEDAADRTLWHQELLKRWVSENPPAQGTGWEPYPTSLRIVNWIKWSLAGNDLSADCRHSLAVQARWLSQRLEFHLLGNHLFSNAKALIFAGLFFEGPEAERWLERGLSILAKEVPEQVLSDGGQFERSPMYHALALEDMLDLCNLILAYIDAVPAKWSGFIGSWPEIVGRMRRWLSVMCHPDGEIAFFNDAAIGIAPVPSELEHYAEKVDRAAQRESSVSWAKGGGSELCTSPDSWQVKQLSESGYIRVADCTAVALLDVAPVGPDYLPGHAHADTLSFELSLYGQRCFVNSGTSVYGQGDERRRQRGTAAHNTVVVDNEDSSEVWAGFRVGRRATPSDVKVNEFEGEVVVSSGHDGYCWLPGKNFLWRIWTFNSGSMVVKDRISGEFQIAETRFHLHPDVKLEVQNENSALLRLPKGQSVELRAEGGRLSTQNASWHPQFGVAVPNLCLVIEFMGFESLATIRWANH